MAKGEPKSADEIRLFEWLTANDVYPGQEDMQTVVINSFYSLLEEDSDDDKLTTLDEIDLVAMGIGEGFDYKAYRKTDEEEEQEWNQKVTYGLNNPKRFLAYINEMWR